MSRKKLLADENIHRVLVKALRELGLDVMWIAESEYRGISNSDVVRLANRLGCTILTRDRDFTCGYIVKQADRGVIYISEVITRQNAQVLSLIILKLLNAVEMRKGRLAVVTTSHVQVIDLETDFKDSLVRI